MGCRIVIYTNYNEFRTQLHVCWEDHITPIMRELHWLPIQQRIDYKIAVLAYKSVNQTAPPYLTEMCRPVSQSCFLARNRSADRGDRISQKWNTVTYGQMGFHYAMPKVWNNLPVVVRQRPTLSAFQHELKTHYFHQAYHT